MQVNYSYVFLGVLGQNFGKWDLKTTGVAGNHLSHTRGEARPEFPGTSLISPKLRQLTQRFVQGLVDTEILGRHRAGQLTIYILPASPGRMRPSGLSKRTFTLTNPEALSATGERKAIFHNYRSIFRALLQITFAPDPNEDLVSARQTLQNQIHDSEVTFDKILQV